MCFSKLVGKLLAAEDMPGFQPTAVPVGGSGLGGFDARGPLPMQVSAGFGAVDIE